MLVPWDYLILTASSRTQAAAYEAQLDIRREMGFLAGVRNVMVVPDPAGQRIGSGGSTLLCLMHVLRRAAHSAALPPDPAAWRDLLKPLRILIVHAGGDSRRLPAYAPGGKIFVPLPGESDSAIPLTLFDRQVPAYLDLPPLSADEPSGQVVVTSGDVLLTFDPAEARFAPRGLTGLGIHADPEQARGHGVYCPENPAQAARLSPVRLYLQKPSPKEQQERGAVDRYGQSILDIGVLAFDAQTAASLLAACGVAPDEQGQLGWTGDIGQAIATQGLDIYREICCALGSQATPQHHAAQAAASGSKWEASLLNRLFGSICKIPFMVQALPRCGFLHFGTTRQIISSGVELLRIDQGTSRVDSALAINNDPANGARLTGAGAWVEGCRIGAPITLEGANVIVGADLDRPMTFPRGACLDVLPGRGRAGQPVHFIRWYGVDDSFKDSLEQATYCGIRLGQWLELAGATAEDAWPAQPAEKSLWNAKIFPAAAPSSSSAPSQIADWIWMLDPAKATDAQRQAWRKADRYSCADIAALTDQQAFYERRWRIGAQQVQRELRRLFRGHSEFSARELAHVLQYAKSPAAIVLEILREIERHHAEGPAGRDGFAFCRLLHTLASALEQLAERAGQPQAHSALGSRLNDVTTDSENRGAALEQARREPIEKILPGLPAELAPQMKRLEEMEIAPPADQSIGAWAARMRVQAFLYLGQTIISSSEPPRDSFRHSLRKDEIVWGRAPVRLDLGGGWSDTPPYTLERGGCVINAAVNLNGQPPIHCYARVIPDPVVRLSSIDLGTRTEIRTLEDLLDFRSPVSEFALAKAALALSGFSPRTGPWSDATTLQQMLEQFGGGIELTTLAAVPKGSGLGTSSIVGAVILSVLWRVMGRQLTQQELFNGVLRLEQALTTGGGWQDQVGGAVEGVKMITTTAGLVPDAKIHYLRSDVLDPRSNGGVTLLYYTGITRLAKNILQNVVGRYLDRDRHTLATLRRIHALPPLLADAMARKDLAAFGRLIDYSWNLNNELDPASTTDEIETLLQSIHRYVYGAKLLGAGGGGFLLIVCKSPQDAATVRWVLNDNPPNDRARFFDFSLSPEGLAVTVS